MKHTLKSWTPYFEDMVSGDKAFDLRLAERVYAVGDEVEFIEWDRAPGGPTGRTLTRRIVYVLEASADGQRFGLKAGHVVLGLAP